MRIPIRTIGLTVLALLASTPAHAQTCGVASSAGPAAGFVRYAMNDGTTGAALGADFSLDGPVAFEVGYRKLLLEGSGSDPDALRGLAAYPVLDAGSVELCALGHAGATRFTLDGEAGTVLAGGVGVRIVSDGPFRPYVGVRGLAGRAVGTILGLSLDATGYALGLEAGAAADLGPLTLRLTGAWDGFDDGLGATPYPDNAAELAIHYRF